MAAGNCRGSVIDNSSRRAKDKSADMWDPLSGVT